MAGDAGDAGAGDRQGEVSEGGALGREGEEPEEDLLPLICACVECKKS